MRRRAILTALSVWLLTGAIAAQAPGAPARPPAPAAAPAPAPAPNPPPFPAESRVAIINMSAVLNGSKLGQAGQQSLKATNDRWNTTLQGLATKVQAIQQELQAQQGTMAAAAYATRKAEGDKAQLELQDQQRQDQAEMQQLSEQLSNDFDAKVLPLIEALRKERNLWLIVDMADQASRGEHISVAAAHPGLDLSAEVIRRLDALK